MGVQGRSQVLRVGVARTAFVRPPTARECPHTGPRPGAPRVRRFQALRSSSRLPYASAAPIADETRPSIPLAPRLAARTASLEETFMRRTAAVRTSARYLRDADRPDLLPSADGTRRLAYPRMDGWRVNRRALESAVRRFAPEVPVVDGPPCPPTLTVADARTAARTRRKRRSESGAPPPRTPARPHPQHPQVDTSVRWNGGNWRNSRIKSQRIASPIHRLSRVRLTSSRSL
jgi:hypothetical protein